MMVVGGFLVAAKATPFFICVSRPPRACISQPELKKIKNGTIFFENAIQIGCGKLGQNSPYFNYKNHNLKYCGTGSGTPVFYTKGQFSGIDLIIVQTGLCTKSLWSLLQIFHSLDGGHSTNAKEQTPRNAFSLLVTQSLMFGKPTHQALERVL